MKNTSAIHASKSMSYEPQNGQEGLEKKSSNLLQSKGQNDGQESALNEGKITRDYESCSDTSISSVELGASAWQQSNWGEYRQLSLWKSIPTHNSSSNTTSQQSQSIPISETINQTQESLTSSQWDSPAPAQVTQEVEQDYLTQHQHSGEKDLDALSKLNPSSVLWNNLKELSDEDLELFLPPSIWQDTLSRLKQSRRESLGRITRDSDCLSFPTLTSNDRSTSRPAGQTKCEKWFKDNGLIAPGYQLSAEAMALIMGFTKDWFAPLSPPIPQEESEPDISQEEQLPQDKQPSPSAEYSISTQLLGGDENSPLQKDKKRLSPSRDISIPCLVKQPKQSEVKGVIKQDLGDRFTVYIPDSDSTITVSKLFVYPDFSKARPSQSVGQIGKNPSKIESPSKNQRRRGEGSGSIHCKPIKRSGKEYKQYWYHYELWEKGDRLIKSCEYIPKRMRSRIERMNNEKVPVAEILKVLRNRSKRKR